MKQNKKKSFYLISEREANEHIADLTNYINFLSEQNQYMSKQLSKWNKDAEIQKLKKELNELQIKQIDKVNFSISEDELKACKKWEHEHMENKHKGQNFGCIGGNFVYCITPTSIGIIGEVKCSCGESFTFRELE